MFLSGERATAGAVAGGCPRLPSHRLAGVIGRLKKTQCRELFAVLAAHDSSGKVAHAGQGRSAGYIVMRVRLVTTERSHCNLKPQPNSRVTRGEAARCRVAGRRAAASLHCMQAPHCSPTCRGLGTAQGAAQRPDDASRPEPPSSRLECQTAASAFRSGGVDSPLDLLLSKAERLWLLDPPGKHYRKEVIYT